MEQKTLKVERFKLTSTVMRIFQASKVQTNFDPGPIASMGVRKKTTSQESLHTVVNNMKRQVP